MAISPLLMLCLLLANILFLFCGLVMEFVNALH